MSGFLRWFSNWTKGWKKTRHIFSQRPVFVLIGHNQGIELVVDGNLSNHAKISIQ